MFAAVPRAPEDDLKGLHFHRLSGDGDRAAGRVGTSVCFGRPLELEIGRGGRVDDSLCAVEATATNIMQVGRPVISDHRLDKVRLKRAE